MSIQGYVSDSSHGTSVIYQMGNFSNVFACNLSSMRDGSSGAPGYPGESDAILLELPTSSSQTLAMYQARLQWVQGQKKAGTAGHRTKSKDTALDSIDRKQRLIYMSTEKNKI